MQCIVHQGLLYVRQLKKYMHYNDKAMAFVGTLLNMVEDTGEMLPDDSMYLDRVTWTMSKHRQNPQTEVAFGI